MSFKNLATTTSVLLLLFGLPMIVAPSAVTDLFAMPESELFNKLVAFIARLYGTLISCCGIALLIARSAGESIARRAITFLIASGTLTSMAVHLYGVYSGLVNVVGIPISVVLGFLSIWAWIIFKRDYKP